MTSIDDLFKKPFLPSSNPGSKRKLETPDAQAAYKAAKLSNGDVKSSGNGNGNGNHNGQQHASVADEDEDDDTEAGPELPPEDEEEAYGPADDEEGRFFGGGVGEDTTRALDYIDQADAADAGAGAGGWVPEKTDAAWLRRLALSFERKINKNSELRAKYEEEPAKFMASEADLDAEIKGLSVLSEHPELYPEFAKIGCAGSLVSLLAHENTDIAIDSIEVISELTDEDVEAEPAQWDGLVEALLEADLVSLLISNFSRFDESQDSDRSGVYHSLSILENLSSSSLPAVRAQLATESTITWLLTRIQAKESPMTQNKQYAAELLQILLQTATPARSILLAQNGLDTLLTLLAPYRRTPSASAIPDTTEQEFVEDLFDALTVALADPSAKSSFLSLEGPELMLLMLRESKFSRTRALKVLDHALSFSSTSTESSAARVAEHIIEAAGLKPLFAALMRKGDAAATEHVLGILATMLRLLPGESAPRIRLLAKFVEKNFEKLARLVTLRAEFSARVAAADALIAKERLEVSEDEQADREDEWFGRRLDAGLFCLRTVDVVVAWLAAEDAGARGKLEELLKLRGQSLRDVKKGLLEQVEGLDVDVGEEDNGTKEMLDALIDCL